MTTPTFDLMTTQEVADALRMPEGTLKYWRHIGTGPRFVKIGRRVMYRHRDVEAYVEQQIQAVSA